MKRKVCVVVTARPSYSRIKTALKAIQNHPDLELQLVVSASALLERYGSSVRYIEDDGFKIAARVYMVLEGENLTSMPKTTGLGLLELATVFVTGCPSIDLAAHILPDPSLNFDPFKRYGGVGAPVDLSNGYLVVMQHPVTTEYKLAREHVFETLCAVQNSGLPTLWFWPNVDAGSDGTAGGIRTFRETERPEKIHFFKHMESTDFLRLVYSSKCLIGNSSAGIRECSFLGVPVVNIGSRQSGRDRGRNVLDVGYDRQAIGDAIDHHRGNGRYPQDQFYGDGRAGKRIARLLAESPLRIEKRLTY